MWKGVSHGIGCLKETLVTVCAERAKGRDSLREARNRLDSLFATDIGKFSSLKAVLRVSI